VFDAEGYTTLIDNTKNSVKSGYYKGGQEVMVKAAKEKHGIEIEGKDIDALLEAYAAKKIEEAGVKPNEIATRYENEKKVL
ncbi:hypothetical protein, partial [Streptococcus pneumoniae]|uniref:hypothetical protein n=1 Tax=Streptococcus pneumoniae TaxID=1313 RepID=UPI0018B0C5F7